MRVKRKLKGLFIFAMAFCMAVSFSPMNSVFAQEGILKEDMTDRSGEEGQNPTYKLEIPDAIMICPESTIKIPLKADIPEEAELKYESDNPAIATVDDNGEVTGIKRKGTAIIKVSIVLEGQTLASATCTVTVEHTPGTEWMADENHHWHMCTQCGKELNYGIGHVMRWITLEEPTCAEKGLEGLECFECNHIVKTREIEANDHDWEDTYTTDQEPSCTQDGSKSIHCKNCDAIKDSEVISKSGHNFIDYVSDDNATCMKDGTETGICTYCQATATRTVKGSALGHQLGEWKIIKEATTTTTGEKERICGRCDYKETEILPVIASEDKNIPSKPNVNKPDSDTNVNKPDSSTNSVKTDDKTNLGLYVSMLAMSGLFVASLTVLGKKRTFGE